MKIKSKTLFLKPFIGKLASEANSKPVFSFNALRITNNTVQEGFKRNVTLAAKKYTFSFYMNKGLEDLNDKEYFSVDILNSANAIVYTYTTKVNATGYYNFDYTATTAGTYTWRFRRVSLNGRSTPGAAYFDDFKVSYNTQQSQQVCSAPKNYRFGFNTQEKDDEVYGAGNLNTAEFWEYDTRIGRRWNTDPRPRDYESPYATFGNNPIAFSDILGDSSIALPNGKIGEAGDNISYNSDKTTLYNNSTLEGKNWDFATWNPKKGEDGGYDFHQYTEISADIDNVAGAVETGFETAKATIEGFVANQFKSNNTLSGWEKLTERQKNWRLNAYIGKEGNALVKGLGIAGKILGYTQVATAGYEFYQNPTWGSATKLLVNTTLVVAKVNPVTGIAMGLLDASGVLDEGYKQIDNFMNANGVKPLDLRLKEARKSLIPANGGITLIF